jgi:DNA-binding FadR family transcriptional regulator
MARLALERHRPEQLGALRWLRGVVADDGREREERFAAAREVLVLLSDMTQNRVWQMLARRARALLASEPLRQARARLRRDPGRLVPIMDKSLNAVERGRPDQAVAALQQLITLLRDSAVEWNDGRGARGEVRGKSPIPNSATA